MDMETQDLQDIRELTRQLYGAIGFSRGTQPALENLRRIFHPEAHLVNNDAGEPLIWSVEGFIAVFRQRLEAKMILEFEEREVAERTEIFGKIAHRFSTYESRMDLSSPQPFSRGINSIQFIRTVEGWRIFSIIWNNEAEGRKVPEKYF